MRKHSFKHNAKQLLIILVASFLTAFSVEVFLLPDDIIVGGLMGIASILDLLICSFDSTKWYLSAGAWLVVMNLPICIYSFKHFRLRFAVKTLIYVLLLSAEMILLRLLNVSELFASATGEHEKVVYLLIGGCLQGFSLPMMLSVNASTGGSDVLGLAIQKKEKFSGNQAMRTILVTNVFVVLLSSIALWIVSNDVSRAINMFIYSIATMFIGEIVQETVFSGFSSALELEVTTDKPEEVSEALRNGLKHGSTSIKVIGGYSKEEKHVVLCVINNRQLLNARRIINHVDPTAFAYVEKVKEVIGKGFANKEEEFDNK